MIQVPASSAIRLPVAADKYYSRLPAALEAELDACLSAPAPTVRGPCLQAASSHGRPRRLAGLIVPHGSMQDSGRVAAAAYSLLAAQLGRDSSSSSSGTDSGGGGSSSGGGGGSRKRGAGTATSGGAGRRGVAGTQADAATNAAAAANVAAASGAAGNALSAQQPARLLMLGTNHFSSQPAACLSGAASWRTPLGDVAVDRELSSELAAQGLPFDDRPHNKEHSLENQLPFLQHTLGRRRPLAILPVCVGWLGSGAAVEQLALQLLAVLGSARDQPSRLPLLLATTDFTHAGPAYGEAVAADWMSLREHSLWRDSPLLHAICRGSASGFLDACDSTGNSLCGRWPVATFMRVAEELGWTIELLSYAPSDLYVQSGLINGFAAFAAWEQC